MQRRQFIASGTALTAALSQSRWLSALEADNKYRNEIGIQLYTLRNEINSDVVGTMKAVADAGYSQVEPYGFPNADDMIREAKANGMAVNSSHINTDGILGPDKKLCVVVRTCAVEEPDAARAIARDALNFYIGLPAYHRTWKQAGFAESDFADGGSDRLVDAIFAWGDIERIKGRIQAHIDAGASEICLYPVNPDEQLEEGQVGGLVPPWSFLEAMAPAA